MVESQPWFQAAPPQRPSLPCRESSRAPHPSVATRLRSTAISSSGAAVRSCLTCQRIAGSESRSQRKTAWWWLDRPAKNEDYAPRVMAASFIDERLRSVGDVQLSSAANALSVDEGVAAVALGGGSGVIALFGVNANGRSMARLSAVGGQMEAIGAVAAADGRVVAVPVEDSDATLLIVDPDLLDAPRIATRWSSGARAGRQMFGSNLGTSRQVALAGSIAWVTDAAGVHAVDIANASAPAHRLTLDMPATDIAIDGDRLLVLEEQALTVYSITGPVASDTLDAVGRVDFEDNRGGALEVIGDVAYTMMTSGQILGWDIADPGSIRVISSYVPSTPTSPDHGDLIAMGDRLAVVRGDIVEVFERRGSLLDSLGSPPAPAGAVAGRAVWDDRNLIVAGGAAGIYAIDGEDAGRLALIGAHGTPGTAHDVAIDGDRIYVADGDGGIRVIRYRAATVGPLGFWVGLPWAGAER